MNYVDIFVGWVKALSVMELIATVSGLACVFLIIKKNVWNFPIGILQTVLYTIIFYRVQLYSDTILQIIFTILQVYGLYNWLRGKKVDDTIRVTYLQSLPLLLYASASLAGACVVGYLMKNYTNASFPYLDSFILCASVIGQWLIAIKKVDTWYFWIAVDCVAIPVYAMKGLGLTTFLYCVFMCMAISGLIVWRKNANRPVLGKVCPAA